NLYLSGGTGSHNNQATLAIGGAAPSVLHGSATLSGHALLQFASGSIGSIAKNATLVVNGGNAFVADFGTSGNTALSGLTNNAGSLYLMDGATVSTTG